MNSITDEDPSRTEAKRLLLILQTVNRCFATPAQGAATESVSLALDLNDQSACLRRKAGIS